MGNTTKCVSNERKDSYIMKLIEKKLQRKDTPFDKKIHSEYMQLIGTPEISSDLKTQGSKKSFVKTIVNEEERIIIFRKWYEMSFPKESNSNKQTRRKDHKSDITPIRMFKPDLKMTPKFAPLNSTKNVKKDTYYNRIPKTLSSVKSVNSIKMLTSMKNVSTFSKTFVTSNNQIRVVQKKPSKESTFNQAECGLRQFKKENLEKFKSRVIKGPPDSFRWLSWLILADLEEDRTEELFFLSLAKEIDKNIDTQIKKDLNRTLSEVFIFSHSQNSLYNVLKAYAVNDSEVEYCQGMNFIAGFLLIMSDFCEYDTYYLMMKIFNESFGGDNNGIRGFFTNDFPLLKKYTFQFDIIFAELLPELKKHFEMLEVPNELWICKWFQTVFTVCLPFELLVRVWDCIFVKGLDFLFNFSIALVKSFQKDLLQLQDIADVSEYFKNMNPYLAKEKQVIIFNIDEIMKDALNIEIKKVQMIRLKKEYENKFKMIDLSEIMGKDNSVLDSSLYKNDAVSSAKGKCIMNDLRLDDTIHLGIAEMRFNRTETKTKKSKIFTNNEDSKKSTNYRDIFSIKKNKDSSFHSDGEEVNNTICSEFDLFDNKNAVIHNVKAHVLNINISAEKEVPQRCFTTYK